MLDPGDTIDLFLSKHFWYFPAHLLERNKRSFLNFPTKGGSSCSDFIVWIPFIHCFNKPQFNAITYNFPLISLSACFGTKLQLQEVEDMHKTLQDLVMVHLWPRHRSLLLEAAHIPPPPNSTHAPSETPYLGAPIKTTKQWAILLKLKELQLAQEWFRWKIQVRKVY